MSNARGICQASGFEFPLSELVKQWDGLLVHPNYLECRNPQDFLRGIPERALNYSSPEPPDRFLTHFLTAMDEVTPLTSLAGIQLTGDMT